MSKALMDNIGVMSERIVVKFTQPLNIQNKIKVSKDQVAKAECVTDFINKTQYVLIDFDDKGTVKVPISSIDGLFEMIRISDDHEFHHDKPDNRICCPLRP